jgi:phage shock protein A
MSVFSRLATLLRSNINDLISRAENPEKILNQLIVDMREQLIEAKKQVAVAIADEKKLRKQLDNELNVAREWEQKAMMAVRAGRDDLAMQALQRKEQHEELAAEYQKQWEAQAQSAEQLRVALRQLHEKIEEARRKKDLLIARQRRAEAQKKIQETIQGFGDNSAFEAFDRMAEKVETMEAQAEATAELAREMRDADVGEKFRELEREAGSSQALDALKRRMGVAAAAPAPAPAAAPAQPAQQEEGFDFEQLERELAEVPATQGAGGSFSRKDF